MLQAKIKYSQKDAYVARTAVLFSCVHFRSAVLKNLLLSNYRRSIHNPQTSSIIYILLDRFTKRFV
jgi:hypothetical protein